MPEQDLPLIDDTVVSLPQDIREDLAVKLSGDLYAFCKWVLGYTEMTKRAHGPTCVFLDHNPAQLKGVGQPRDTFKTSIGTIGRNLQGVVRQPDRTKLLANENATNSERFLRAIRQHAESNRRFRALYSFVIPKDTRRVRWNDQELDFNREVIRPEPTIDTIGMTGAWTSRHYDDVTFDDIISEDAAKSDKVMKDITDRAVKFRALFRFPDITETIDAAAVSTLTALFTRWGYADAYSVLFQRAKFALLIRGAIEDDGPMFPEHLPEHTLAKLRDELGEYMFSCLYLNAPRNEEIQDFNVRDLRFFGIHQDKFGTWFILYDGDGKEFRRYRQSQLDITATVDLAAAEKVSSDRNAVTVVGMTPTGEALVLESWAKRCNPLELMTFIFYCQRRWECRVWGIEDVAYQKAFKYFLADYAEQVGDLYFNVKPIGAVKAKEVRIRGLQPIAATHRLYLLPTHHVLRNELAAFPLGQHDDAADSLSMQLQLWQGRLSPRRLRRQLEVERETLRQLEWQDRTLAGVAVEAEDNLGIDLESSPIWNYDG